MWIMPTIFVFGQKLDQTPRSISKFVHILSQKTWSLERVPLNSLSSNVGLSKEHLPSPDSLPSNMCLLTDANLGLLHGGWQRRKGKSYTSIRINDVPNICRPMTCIWTWDDKICLIFYLAYDNLLTNISVGTVSLEMSMACRFSLMYTMQ